jgi:DNA-binding CsgD family transcriptional regulator
LSIPERKIIEMRLAGHDNVEIAEKLGISDRKIRRLLERMRGQAEKEEPLA